MMLQIYEASSRILGKNVPSDLCFRSSSSQQNSDCQLELLPTTVRLAPTTHPGERSLRTSLGPTQHAARRHPRRGEMVWPTATSDRVGSLTPGKCRQLQAETHNSRRRRHRRNFESGTQGSSQHHQPALKSFKLLGREKRCRTEQSVPTAGGFADTKANSAINVGRVTGNSLRFGALSELRVDLPG